MPLPRNKFATHNHAQLTALLLLGPNGQTVANHVEVDKVPDLEPLKYPLAMEERNALLPMKETTATLNHAQSIVSCPNGANGPIAPRVAEWDSAHVVEILSLRTNSEELLVDCHLNGNHATYNHAQLTVLCLTGQFGEHAQNHVELDQPPELARLLLKLSSMERHVELPLKPSTATLNLAQLTASCPNGLHSPHVTRHAVEDLDPEPELSHELPNLEELPAVMN